MLRFLNNIFYKPTIATNNLSLSEQRIKIVILNIESRIIVVVTVAGHYVFWVLLFSKFYLVFSIRQYGHPSFQALKSPINSMALAL